MLLLKKHLVALVRAGKKRQTIRYWTRPIVFPGQISFTPGLGKMKILRVEELPGYQALTLDDALADGFTSLAELLAELQRNYPQVPPGKRLYRVVFQWPVALSEIKAPAVVLAEGAAVRMVDQATENKKLTEKSAVLALSPKCDSAVALSGNESTAKADSHDQVETSPAGGMPRWQKEQLRDWVMAQSPNRG
ncbi:MAG: ASCH domain-containing protein [Phycisphaerae bacterium]